MSIVQSQYQVVRRWPLLLTITLAAALFPANSTLAARKPVEIRSIQTLEGSETDFIISANQTFQFYMFALKNPERLVVDCRSAILPRQISETLLDQHPSVIGIRAARFQNDIVRVVFNLKGPAKYSALATDGTNLRIRIQGRSQTNLPAQQARIQAPSTPSAQESLHQDSIRKTTSQPQKSTTDVDLSISTEKGEQAVRESNLGNKNRKRRLPVKTQGYVVDHFQRNVVSGKHREASTGSSYGMNVRYKKQNKKKNASLNVAYNIAGHEYAEPFVDDYMSQDFTVGYELKLNPRWSLKTAGRMELTEYGDRYGFRPELKYRLTPRSQLSFYGGHRLKILPDYQERTDQDRYFGFSYKSKVFRNQTLELAYQRNFNDSEKNRYDYSLSRYTIGYTVPWNRQSRTVFKLDYTPKQYISRLIKVDPLLDPDFETLREDQGYTFSVISRFRLSKHWELQPRYIFQIKNSNELNFEDYTLHIPSVALRANW
jgi:hypothetical protein